MPLMVRSAQRGNAMRREPCCRSTRQRQDVALMRRHPAVEGIEIDRLHGSRASAFPHLHPLIQQRDEALPCGAEPLIESEKPGLMASRGLDFPALSAEAPNPVMTSITPIGQTGPYAQYECDDLVALALGGLLYLGAHRYMPTAVPVTHAYPASA